MTMTPSTPARMASLEISIVSEVSAVPVPAITAARPFAASTTVRITFTRSSRVSEVASPVQPQG